MKQYGLNLVEEGFYHREYIQLASQIQMCISFIMLSMVTSSNIFADYDSTVDGRIANEFSAAAFRFGHTLIQDRFRRSDSNYNNDDSLMLSSVSYNHISVCKLFVCWYGFISTSCNYGFMCASYNYCYSYMQVITTTRRDTS